VTGTKPVASGKHEQLQERLKVALAGIRQPLADMAAIHTGPPWQADHPVAAR
jgi:hypothetical protein